MDDKKMNSDFDELFGKKLENLPEEILSENDWQQMRSRMEDEGLIGKKSRRKRYFIFLLLIVCISVLISIPFLNKKAIVPLKHAPVQSAMKIEENTKVKEKERGNEKVLPNDRKEKTILVEETKNETIVSKPIDEKKSTLQLTAASKREQEKNIPPGEKTLSVIREEKKEGHQQPMNIQTKEVNDRTQAIKNPAVVDTMEANTEANTVSVRETVHPGSGNPVAVIPPDTLDEKRISDKIISVNTDSASVKQSVIPPKKDTTQTVASAESKTKPQDTTKISRFRLGIYFSWDFNHYELKESDNVTKPEADYVLNSDSIAGDKSSGQFTAGIMGSYRANKKLAIEVGVFYSQKKKVDAVIYTPKYSFGSAEAFSDVIYHFNARYIEVYARAKYYAYQRKQSFYVSAGASGSFNFPMKKSDLGYFRHTIYSESSSPHTDHVIIEPSSMSLSIIVSGGMEISVGEKLDLFFEPSYKYALNPVIKHPTYDGIPVEHFWRCISLGAGLMYKF